MTFECESVTESTTTPAPSVSPPDDTLPAALARHSIVLADRELRLIEQYVRLLWEWNEKLNLTRHTDFEKFVGRDLRDTIELAKLLHQSEEVLDVGTGGGVPGLVLALLRPDLRVTLCDSVAKKVRAVESMAEELKVPVEAIVTRAEEQLDDARYDALLLRAVGPLPKILRWFKPHWGAIGRLLTFKGPKWIDERAEARRQGLLNDLELRKAAEYPMLGTDSSSVILKIWRKGMPEW